jgi:single-stranded-DNA-specific exonuclease
MSNYSIKEPVPSEVQQELSLYSPFLQQLLYGRGITTKEAAVAFLNPSYNDHLHDPFLLHDMDVAVQRILKAITADEHIVIYSDYDCDGIPGAVVLHDFFKAIGYENFSNYIPHRHYEGFGFSIEAVRKLVLRKPALIITIDCGTTDHEAVAEASALGIDVIITDHHEAKETLPCALAVVNPKVGGTYPFEGLCGSGVVYKLVQALIAQNISEKKFELKEGWEKWWLDMVAIATIADMVPLVGENRALAHYGLQVLRKSRRPGLVHLVHKQKASLAHLTEDDIGFTIGPRINAASRMDTPEDAFLMLSCSEEKDAGAYVEHLEKLNNERKGIVSSMTKETHKRLHLVEVMPSIIVIGNPEWRPSLAGLLANKIAEEFKRPAFVWGRDGNGVIKGSCRSDGTVSVVTLMNEVSHMLLEHGGHHFSGGFGVQEEHIHTFGAAINEAFLKMGDKAFFEAMVSVDASLSLDAIDRIFIKEQSQLAPFGTGNPKPLYVFEKITPREVAVFGKSKEHMKLLFDTNGLAREAIAFFMMPSDFKKVPKAGEAIDLYAHVEQSFFMGRMQTRLRIVDIV